MKIFIVPIEPIDQRYTAQWYTNIPLILKDHIQAIRSEIEVVTVSGKQTSSTTTAGAFLDFAATNIYKSTQVTRIAELFQSGQVKSGDRFLITDAWNFAITAIKYMSELLDIPVEIHSIWHAGCYDPSDILGMKMSNNWASNQERSWYYASDFNYFATNFHMNMFEENLAINKSLNKSYRSGQPHSLIIKELEECNSEEKSDLVLFPHRLNSDKQPNIAEDLVETLNGLFLITQPLKLEKKRYYNMLGKAKAVFSCALHENLGISMMEGVLAGAMPIVPDRCSYSEMYLDDFKYPSVWTSSYDNYQKHKGLLKNFILNRVKSYDTFRLALAMQKSILIRDYLTPTTMLVNLTR